MRIVLGRGNNRQAFILPCGQLIKRAEKGESDTLVSNVCSILGVK